MNKRKISNLNNLLRYFPENIRSKLPSFDEETASELCEIRMRAERPIVLVCVSGMKFITDNGRLTEFFSNELLKADEKDIRKIFESMCAYSVYSVTQNICDGFITVENGCRVGVYGTAISDGIKTSAVRNIRGLNIRIPGEHNGVSSEILALYKEKMCNLLICGPPSSGKTTMIKDLCRNLSDELNYKLAVIDERFEFSNYYLGYNTDVLSGYSKPAGLTVAVRTLSPEIIAFDELGTDDEVETVINGLNCGVKYIMSIHCSSMDELVKKKQIRILLENKAIERVVFLKNLSEVSAIFKVKEAENAFCGTGDNFDFLQYDRKLLC